MRHATLLELAERDGISLPDSLVEDWPPRLSATDEKGWFRFQRLYDVARSVLRTEADVRRLVLEAAEDDVRDGGRWLEIQVDPSGYAARFGGITAFTDLVLDAVRDAEQRTGLGMAVVIAANRTRHPLDARTLARLAAQYVGRGRGRASGCPTTSAAAITSEFAAAFPIAERAGLLLVPHGGELLGPDSIRTCLDVLHAGRLGHGVRAAEDPACWTGSSQAGVAARGVPGLQRGARRLLRPDLGAAADAARGRRDGRARRRRPAAVRVAAGRAVRHDARRPRPRPTSSSPSWPGCRCGPRGRPTTRKSVVLAEIDAWLAPEPAEHGRHERTTRRSDAETRIVHAPAHGSRSRRPRHSRPSGPRRAGTLPAAGHAEPSRTSRRRRRPAATAPRTARLRTAGPYGQPAYGSRLAPPYGTPPASHPEANSALVMGIVAAGAGTFVCGITPGVLCGPFAWAHGRQGAAGRSTPTPALGGAGRGHGRLRHGHHRHDPARPWRVLIVVVALVFFAASAPS